MKNKKMFVIIILLSVVVISLGFAYINKHRSTCDIINDKNTEYAISISEKFIKELFTGSPKVLDYSTGSIRRNLKVGMDKLPKYNINDIICMAEYASGDFATINTIVEFTKPDESIDVDFHKLYLIKENDQFLVYDLEKNMVFNSNNTVNDIEISSSGLTETIDSYLKNISNDELSKSAEHLIGTAKSDHEKSFDFISKAMGILEYNISDINHNILSSQTGRLALVRSDYLNNGKDISIVFTLFKTSKGWKIYEIKQI